MTMYHGELVGKRFGLIYSMCLLVLLFLFNMRASFAEIIQIDLEGAIVPIYLDLENGFLYIDGDCNPFLKFSEKITLVKNKTPAREFIINKMSSRSGKKSLRQGRLPSSILVKNNEVTILSKDYTGSHYATGRVVFTAMRKSKSLVCD